MSCEETRRLLDDFVDGDLPDRARNTVETHLRDCAECGRDADALLSLIAQARALSASVEPPRDLWPQIACRLDGGEVAARPRFGGSPVWRGLLAASIVTAAVLGVLTLSRTFFDGRTDGEPVATAEGSAEATREVSAALADAEQGLRATFEQRRSELPAETAAEVDRNLQIIEKAIDDIRVAVDRDPGNTKLNQMLITAQRREVDFLQQVTRRTLLF